jgi:uncharacterized protein YerC
MLFGAEAECYGFLDKVLCTANEHQSVTSSRAREHDKLNHYFNMLLLTIIT